MNYLRIILLLLPFIGFSQQKESSVKATNSVAQIIEKGQPIVQWNLDPSLKLDVFTTNKIIKSTEVLFKTDLDSILIKLEPGQKKDFVVLLNNTDSCFTRIQGPEIKNFEHHIPEFHDSIKMVLNEFNTNLIRAVLNKKDTLDLNFDSGTTQIVLTEKTLKEKFDTPPILYSKIHELMLGNKPFESLIFDAKLSGHQSDGRFGWDLFDGMILEMNYDENLMVVHSKMPNHVRNDNSFSKFNMKYYNTLFLIEAEINNGSTSYKDWYLFDTGYQKSMMLDKDLLDQNAFLTTSLPILETTILRGAMGNEIPVNKVNMASFKLGGFELKNVPAQIIAQNKPMAGSNIHILGTDILKRFNVFFDFQKNQIYLKPNSNFDMDWS